MHEGNLTRFGPETYQLIQGKPTTYRANFKAIEGSATLKLYNSGVDNAWITVNGQSVVEKKNFGVSGEVVLPLTLKKENTIEVRVPGLPQGQLGVRITQTARADLGLERQGYFGLNTTDIKRQRAFYETLGFTGEIYPAGPETSTTFAQSLGFPEDYLIHVALTSLYDPPVPPFVDTVEFRENSFRSEPPYANLNHLGMAYATYSTTDLDGDYAYLKDKGVEFVSAPVDAPDGERFVFLKEPDGAFLKLIQAEPTEKSAVETANGTHLVRLVNTNMNVSDLERSREFYRMLGFTQSKPRSMKGSGEFAAAHGFDGEIEFDGVDISLGEGTDGATIQLRQWKTPYDPAIPYPPPVNHLGIDRINFYVKDLVPVLKTMEELGIERLGPPGGRTDVSIAFFFDPDGIKVQLAGPYANAEAK